MPKGLSSEEKVLLIKRYLLGERISTLSREAKVSRTILYRWIYLYKDSREYQFKNLFRSRLAKGRKHYKKIPRSKEARIINFSLRNPNFSTRKLASLSNVSHNYVWSVLQKHALTDIRKGVVYNSGSVCFKRTHLSAVDKITMIRRFESGEKIAQVCRDFGVSRTIFYKWLKIYEAAPQKHRTVNLFNRENVHYRYVPEVRKLATEIVIADPRLSLRCMREEMIKRIGNKAVSRQAIHKVLKELHLDSKEKRINFSKLSVATVN